MIEISSIAKTASRNCDNALSYDYYEMLLRRRPVEEEMYSVLEMMVATEPVAKANLHCQFPKHESLLNDIKTCSFMVEGKAVKVPALFLHAVLHQTMRNINLNSILPVIAENDTRCYDFTI